MVGDADDVLGAAVIALERDDPAAREVFLELEDVREVRAAPSVNRLIGVAGDAEVGVLDRERPDDRVLGQVGILIFINQHILEPSIELGADVFVFLEDRHHVHQQVVEIDGRSHLEPSFVELVDLGQPSSLAGPGRGVSWPRG